MARRQARVIQKTGSKYLDNLYDSYQLCVELDGSAAHPAEEQWRDKRRDRANLVQDGITTMRLGYRDIRTQDACCETALDVATVLQSRASFTPHPCSRGACPFPPP